MVLAGCQEFVRIGNAASANMPTTVRDELQGAVWTWNFPDTVTQFNLPAPSSYLVSTTLAGGFLAISSPGNTAVVMPGPAVRVGGPANHTVPHDVAKIRGK
jgi:hypothetical protein